MELSSVPETPVILGIIFILAGAAMRILPPKKINSFYGYRTPLSMSSPERWTFAQRYSANKLVESAIVLLLVSFFFGFFALPESWIDWIGVLLIAASIFYPVFSTEIAIKKHLPTP